MMNKLKMNMKSRRYGRTVVIAVGLPFLVAGILIASGLQWTSLSVAEEITGGPRVTAVSPPAMPSSFAELAEKLSPTVVNVKVTKVEKATFRGPRMPEGPFGDFFGEFFKNRPRMPRSHRSQGAGSGVIINGETVEKSAHAAKGKWGLQLHDLSPEVADRYRLKADEGAVVVGV